MRDLHARSPQTYRLAAEAGITMHAGTDAGGYIEHGRIIDEVQALTGIGLSVPDVLVSATHGARSWLGLPGYESGAAADLLVYDRNPVQDLDELRRPAAILRAGQIRAGSRN